MTNPNDSASPIDKEITIPCDTYFIEGSPITPVKVERIQSNGWTKYEEAHLRFMCAIVSNPQLFSHLEMVAPYATELTNAYFNELNKDK